MGCKLCSTYAGADVLYYNKYIHADITPFEMLDEEEKGKDLLLVENMNQIL